MGHIIVFGLLSVFILGSAVMCVLTKSIMRAATFLLFVLFGVAGIYLMLDYTFLGAAQIAVYAGGITVMYVFAIQLVSKRALQNMVERLDTKRMVSGGLAALLGLVVVASIVLKNKLFSTMAVPSEFGKEVAVKEVGHALVSADKYGYVLPFEFISLFILACIVGGILIARKEEKQ